MRAQWRTVAAESGQEDAHSASLSCAFEALVYDSPFFILATCSGDLPPPWKPNDMNILAAAVLARTATAA